MDVMMKIDRRAARVESSSLRAQLIALDDYLSDDVLAAVDTGVRLRMDEAFDLVRKLHGRLRPLMDRLPKLIEDRPRPKTFEW